MKAITLDTGQKFNRWTVLSRAENKEGKVHWVCKCECGTVREVQGHKLRSGISKSCGCYKLEYLTGKDNPQARKSLALHGKHIPSNDLWYNRAGTIKSACKRKGIPFGFASIVEFASHLKEIAPTNCPVFKQPLSEKGGSFDSMSPSVDKIIPSKGYVRGNLQVISYLANSMKRDATPEQLKQFAQWINK